MKFLKAFLLFILFAIAAGNASAQKFLWEVDFDYRFDNREYSGSRLAKSETLFGVRLMPLVGMGWGNGNSVIIGGDFMTDFGSSSFSTRPSFLIYYNYNSDKYSVYAGVFPRNRMMGEYSNAFFSDAVQFYDGSLDGMLLQYRGARGYVELGCDWNGKYDVGQREKFMIFSSGRIQFGAFYAGYNGSMYHYSVSPEHNGVVDNMLTYPFIGADFTGRWGFRRLYVQAGWLQAFQNDRLYVGKYVRPGGFQGEVCVERWGLGIYNSIYIGKNIMPYYTPVIDGQPEYGAGLYCGELFYRTDSGIYNRGELYWDIISKPDVKIRISAINHFDGRVSVWQQMVTIRINLSDRMFRKNRKPATN